MQDSAADFPGSVPGHEKAKTPKKAEATVRRTNPDLPHLRAANSKHKKNREAKAPTTQSEVSTFHGDPWLRELLGPGTWAAESPIRTPLAEPTARVHVPDKNS